VQGGVYTVIMAHLSRKGQLSIEAGFVLFFTLLVLMTLWLGGPLYQSTEQSIDTNGVLLGMETLNELSSAVTIAGSSGIGARHDFTVHIPFNTADMRAGDGSFILNGTTHTGPHINLTVLLYSNPPDLTYGDLPIYRVGGDGMPLWNTSGGSFNTSMYYVTLTKPLDFKIRDGYFLLCDRKKDAFEMRGPSTRLLFTDSGAVKPIMLCEEAGFNMNVYAEQEYSANPTVSIRDRLYYSLPSDWVLTP